ncbi:MAG: DUF3859 domain-containing protein [Desulfobacteraceae bacterium]|nr:DUF3859 domain-containing protein [Desulfobacteraceae bacterium]MBC2754980.1 DUF3859 domain-containing protein [Desulfobacteraceae bacterium]
MKHRTHSLYLLTLLTLICLPVICDAFRMVSGQITQAGIYEAESIEKVKAPETTTGYTTNATGLKLVKTTDTIPAKLGLSFGFEYVLIGLEPNKNFRLKKIISHPKITKPDGSVSEGYEMMITKKADAFGTIKDISGYIFNNDYEIQPGEWKFTLMYEDEKLIEKTFVVVKE